LEVSKSNVLSKTIGPFRISPFLQSKLCYVGQKEVFEEGRQSLKELAGIEVDAKQIERVSHFWGAELAEFMKQTNLENLNRSKGLHYVMVDGAMILSREDSWKEVKLGRIFHATSLYVVGNESYTRGWIRKSNYTAHVGNCHDFFEKFSPKVDQLEQFICIGDGAKWIWEWCGTNYPEAPQILDYWHATEHLWKFIKLHYKAESMQNSWIEQQQELLWTNAVEQVIKNVESIKTKKRKSKEEQEKLLTYLNNNKDRMRYGEFKANGWLVGSGPVEAAHRTVIQKRLKLSGQRWTLVGAQQILNLRVEHKNDNWNKLIKLMANTC
jgi:hypothetical protein